MQIVEMNKYKLIVMIPARLGSQRVPQKNIRYMGEKPLIAYPIELSVNSGLFQEVWVNTESEALGKLAENYGANFHQRPEKLASNTATNRDFTYEFLIRHECDYVIMVNTTSPLISKETLIKFVNYINCNDFDTVLSVVSEKTECFLEGRPINFDVSEKINSQFLTPVKRTVWCLTAWKRESFINMQKNGKNPVFGGKIGLFEIPKDESSDIDTEEDWKLAEGILQSKCLNVEARYLKID